MVMLMVMLIMMLIMMLMVMLMMMLMMMLMVLTYSRVAGGLGNILCLFKAFSVERSCPGSLRRPAGPQQSCRPGLSLVSPNSS